MVLASKSCYEAWIYQNLITVYCSITWFCLFTFYDYFRFWLISVMSLVMHWPYIKKWNLLTSRFYSETLQKQYAYSGVSCTGKVPKPGAMSRYSSCLARFVGKIKMSLETCVFIKATDKSVARGKSVKAFLNFLKIYNIMNYGYAINVITNIILKWYWRNTCVMLFCVYKIYSIYKAKINLN